MIEPRHRRPAAIVLLAYLAGLLLGLEIGRRLAPLLVVQFRRGPGPSRDSSTSSSSSSTSSTSSTGDDDDDVLVCPGCSAEPRTNPYCSVCAGGKMPPVPTGFCADCGVPTKDVTCPHCAMAQARANSWP